MARRGRGLGVSQRGRRGCHVRCGCGGAKLEWKPPNTRSGVAPRRGRQQQREEEDGGRFGRKAEEGARRGKGAVIMHLVGPWGDKLLLGLWLGRWWRLAPGHEVVRCFELSTDAGVRQGGSAPVPKAQGGSGRGGPSPQFGTRGGGAEGVIVFFYRLPHHLFVALVAEQPTPEGGIKGDRKRGVHLRGPYGGWWFGLEASSGGDGSRGNPGTRELFGRCTPRP